jgi:2-oxoglutarate dehydrogenase E2 component (dihydrolipoamide succinyltransferase)
MEIKVPEIGESVFEAVLAKWHQQDGADVAKDDLLCELETDKITLELHAEEDGTLSIKVAEGETVEVGAVIAILEEKPGREKKPEPEKAEKAAPEKEEEKPEASEKAEQQAEPKKVEKPPVPPEKGAEKGAEKEPKREKKPKTERVEKHVREEKPQPVEPPAAPPAAPEPEEAGRTTRKPLTPIRKRIAERLVAARQQTAMLTTFNEADMSRVQELRRKYQKTFQERHQVKLGLMSFFVKAAVEALKAYPEVNARLEEDAVVYQHFHDIGIAVNTEKGLVVPVLRDADHLHFAEIEQGIVDFIDKIANNRLDLADLQGGTFTISNGGVFGSLLSTPLLNPPQCAVLGMHAIQDRAVVHDGQVVVRPMMYLALSYDHRLIDGRQAVEFLKRIKELVEEPEEMLLEF